MKKTAITVLFMFPLIAVGGSFNQLEGSAGNTENVSFAAAPVNYTASGSPEEARIYVSKTDYASYTDASRQMNYYVDGLKAVDVTVTAQTAAKRWVNDQYNFVVKYNKPENVQFYFSRSFSERNDAYQRMEEYVSVFENAGVQVLNNAIVTQMSPRAYSFMIKYVKPRNIQVMVSEPFPSQQDAYSSMSKHLLFLGDINVAVLGQGITRLENEYVFALKYESYDELF